jgi:predicted Zn-dependent protease
MSLRDRTRKRLRWFVIGLVVLIVVGAAGYVLRNRQLDKRAIASRDAGLKELAAGDYFHALNDIGRYVQRHPDDAKTLYSYAQAREQVPAPDNRHIHDAMSLYRRVISLDPKNTGACESLLKLYTRTGMFAEAQALSQDVIKSDPGNRQAMKAHAVALFALGNGASASSGPGTRPTTQTSREQALPAALAYNEKWPDDLDGQLLTLQILSHANDGRAKMIEHVQSLLDKSPKDPHFQLLMGYVKLATGADRSEAKKWIDQASQGALPDTASLKLLVELCDRMGLFQQSFQALQRQASESSDPEARQLLAGRLWEMQRYDDLATKFSGDVSGDGDIAALRCMSLQQSGKRADALSALKALETASADNPRLQRWASVAKAVVSSEKPDDAAIISACEAALREGEDPHIRMLLADSYMRTGDADTAVDSWQTVFKMRPAWGTPLLRLAQASLASGRSADAEQLAQEALNRLPDNVPAMLALAGAQAMNLTPSESADAQKTLKLLDQIDRLSPNNPAIEPLRVQLLATINQKDQALQQAEKMLAPTAKPSTAELLQLASISRAHHLGVETRCIQRCQQLHGVSVDLALWNANVQLQSGHRSEALAAFDQVRQSAGSPASGADALSWDRARAKLLETLGDKSARSAWESLADKHADDPQVQWLAISVPSVRSDRAFVRKVLDRLRDQLGDQGLRWRMTQAQWLLADTDNSQSAADAALLLKQLTTSAPDMVAPRLMLADCLLRLGNYSGAVQQLTDSLARQPQATGIALKLAALLQSHNENARARGYIDRVTQNPAANLADIRQAAQLLDAQGDPQAGVAALEHAYGDALKQNPADLVLARLYLRTGQLAKVDAISKKLLVKPDAADLKFVADFYISTGRAADAEAAMKRLDTVPTAPGEKEIAWGAYLMRTGQRQKAQASFASATKIAPENADGWRQLIRVQLSGNQDSAAAQTARSASSALPKDPGFAAYTRNSATAESLKKNWPEIVPLLAELLSKPDQEQVFTTVCAALDKSQNGVLPNSALDNLSSQAAGHPESAPLQVLSARGSILAGRMSSPEERVKWMKFAANMDPDPRDAARWLAAIEKLSMKGDIHERLALAETWQALATRSKDPADQAHASKLVDAVASSPDCDKLQAPGLLSLGCLQEGQEKLAPAETNYRKAAQLDPKMGIPQNNLAMLLARKHERLDEALKFAKEAVAVGGNLRASFLDTLAFVQGQRGDFAAAVDAAKEALALQPAEPRFKVRLANMLIDDHQADRAKPILKELQSPDLKTAPADVQKDIQSLEQRLSGTASASSGAS